MEENILILDFGSQYTQLIARRVRELNVYCEIHPYNDFPHPDQQTKGIILSGSPYSVQDNSAPAPDLSQLLGKFPILSVCYGAQYIAHSSGGDVLPSEIREYGRANLTYINQNSKLLHGMTDGCQVWMSHGDTILNIPANFEIITSTSDVKVGGFKVKGQETYGIQFHPEVYHTTEGMVLLRNFIADICGCKQKWTAASFVEQTIHEIRKRVGSDKVVLGISGGVDSTVAATLINKAIGDQLFGIFVNNGLLRKREFKDVLKTYNNIGLNVTGVDASDRFLQALKDVSEPEKKRKIIGRMFIEVFDEEAHKIRDVKWLAQGTIYPDVIESKSVKGPSSTIKSHHNVGGLPEKMNLKILEPLNNLFKDEVRKVGQEIGVPENLINRHPFPGPGLAIRILGDITKEKVRILQDVDDIYVNGLKEYNLYDDVWQAAAILLPVQSVGVMGDERTYENVVALRAVGSTDGMTADWSHLPYEFLAKMSNDIINKVSGVNRVVYDISSKPPATIEWE